MTCQLFEETLPAYLYDELPGEERAAYDAHRAECEPCRRLLEDSRRLQLLLNQRAGIEFTPDMVVHCRQGCSRLRGRNNFATPTCPIHRWRPRPGAENCPPLDRAVRGLDRRRQEIQASARQ